MELNLKDFLSVISRKKWIVLIVVFVICGATFAYKNVFTTPQYEASVKVLVNKENVSNSGVPNLDVNTINTNILLVNSYIEVLHTPFIMDEVVKRLGDSELTKDVLQQKIGTNRAEASQVMTITVMDENYKRAAKIANIVAQVFKEKIPTAFKVDNITILSYAEEQANASPVSNRMMLSLVVALIGSLLLGVGVSIILEFVDDRIKFIDDTEKTLGQPILGVIAKVTKKDTRMKRHYKKIREGEHAVFPQ